MAPVKTFVRVNKVFHLPITYATDLDHDHREREDIRLLAECPPIGQDLRCHPSPTVHVLVWGPLYRIHTLGDQGETAICDHRMAGGVHKDV